MKGIIVLICYCIFIVKVGYGQKFLIQDGNFNNLSTSARTQGVAVADFNNDGFLDVFITAADPFEKNRPESWSRLYSNNGNGTFKDVTVASGLFTEQSRKERSDITVGVRSGASWGDFNNDGFVDLFLANDGLDFLYQNNGDGTFSDITSKAGVGGCAECYSGSGLWWDFDGDGDLDLYVSDWGRNNRMYVNIGDATFVESAKDLGLAKSVHSWMALPFDVDGDGHLDLYVSNDNEPNALYVNRSGVFVDLAEEYGVNDSGNGMGIGLSDYNLDGIFDIYVTNIFSNKGNPFFVRDSKSGAFQDKAKELNIDNTAWGWDIAFFDADHDMDEDLSVATYGSSDRNYFFKNSRRRGIRNFLDASGSSGISQIGASFGLESFDYDNDGDIDLLFSNSIKEPFLFENTIEKDGSNTNWVQINLVGTRSNRDAFGAQVRISIAGKNYIRLQHGAGVGRQSKKPLHFGLAGNERIEQLEVIWPNGNVEKFTDIPANVSVLVTEEQGLTISPLTKAVKIDRNHEFDLSKSIARIWNEELLEAIREDLARPTVHARNLFHVSGAMYDVLAAFDETLHPYLLGNSIGDFTCDYNSDVYQFNRTDENIRAALSYAVFKMMKHRFKNSPGNIVIMDRINALMKELGYDAMNGSMDLSSGSSIALGNFIGQCYIDFGLQDGSNEVDDYSNKYYESVNPPLVLTNSGNESIVKPNRWQPLTLETFIDQSGNVLSDNTPDFLSPEWGNVIPFSLSSKELTSYERDGNMYNVYLDPGAPPLLSAYAADDASDNYKWGFSLVSAWSSHLSPSDGVLWDISPANIGNVKEFPSNVGEYNQFYDLQNGGDGGAGRDLNPITGRPYEKNIVPRGDYTRVLAEFWADGPRSETPPGHWFTILNYVNDDSAIVKKLEGTGEFLSDLYWDVFGYFTLGGAMHDSAISSWGIKGYYDYLRPISAIRYMSGMGQSSDPTKPSYDPQGVILIEGLIELVGDDDPIALNDKSKIGAIKVKAWKGPSYIKDEKSDVAGVDWILAENWWPYQRPSFVTPPFAGYISGHSTYSRAAAEVLTRFTGSEYFPGGLGEFVAPKNEFLVFEDGPSVDVVLQWATYRDASDQCSLSRIWGGIHPPADDIPGRKIGEYIGNKAFDVAKTYFGDVVTAVEEETLPSKQIEIQVFPNPSDMGYINIKTFGKVVKEVTLVGTSSKQQIVRVRELMTGELYRLDTEIESGIYILNVETTNGIFIKRVIVN